MLFDKKRKFLFKCEDCSMLLIIELEESQDLKDIQEDKMKLECPCGSVCVVLRN
jgi:hypothetical protein